MGKRDPFGHALSSVVYGQLPLTRKERADKFASVLFHQIFRCRADRTQQFAGTNMPMRAWKKFRSNIQVLKLSNQIAWALCRRHHHDALRQRQFYMQAVSDPESEMLTSFLPARLNSLTLLCGLPLQVVLLFIK